MKFKRIAALILSAALLLAFPAAAHAEGDGNIDHGGGNGMGDAGDSWWNGDDGVRVTVIRASDNKVVSRSIDITNYDESDAEYHFIRKCKILYRNGSYLQADRNGYNFSIPTKPMPKIITETGTSSITAIRSYFTDRQVIKSVARLIGTSYEQLTGGKYKLLLEPVAYFFYNGRHKYAMTATEAALYDEALDGGLRAVLVSLTHQQLPLSMFLEKPDLGYPAFHGDKTGRQSNAMIISQLGLGVVKFKDSPSDAEGDPSHAEYRCDTDVITSVMLNSNSEINPGAPASVTFHVLGGSYTVKNVVMPAEDSQLVWVKWHTPKTPQTVQINIEANKGKLDTDVVDAKVIKLEEKTPPNPIATDRNDSFRPSSVPNQPSLLASSWSVWSAKWVPNWVWESNMVWDVHSDWPSGGQWIDHGRWIDHGKYDFTSHAYRATLEPRMILLPDDKDPTAQGKLMKSGYGVKVSVPSSTNATVRSWVTGAQTAITYFPEFGYKTYWRILDLTKRGLDSCLEFKNNKYSTYNRRVHFTPIWYPDSTYTAYTYLEDAWTPAGMLSANLTDSTQIKGSVYDDWHIGPKLNNR